MTHRDEGHYAGKHGERAPLDQAIADAIRRRSTAGRVSCAAAFRIARDMTIEPPEVGRALDLLEIKIIKCQLGLFGYEQGRHPGVKPPEAISPQLERALKTGLVDGRLPCAIAWEIAERFDVSKMTITSACEALNIRISRCQLGSF